MSDVAALREYRSKVLDTITTLQSLHHSISRNIDSYENPRMPNAVNNFASVNSGKYSALPQSIKFQIPVTYKDSKRWTTIKERNLL